MRIAVTGAAGFIGRAVVDRIAGGALGAGNILLLNDLRAFERADASVIMGSYADPAVRDRLLGEGVDLLFHLASLPGGAAEADFAAGRLVNLDATLALIDAAAARSARPPVIVYTSSIAALGMASDSVGPETPLRPTSSYGAHKAMIELYAADLTRRGMIDGRSVRPAGIVARPVAAYDGFATAWMSELFRGLHAKRDVAVPWRGSARVWLQSVDALAEALLHAARMPAEGLAASRAWTLPATVARLDELVAAIALRTGAAGRVSFGEGAGQLELDTRDALALGFRGDGDADALAGAVLARLEREGLAARDNIP